MYSVQQLAEMYNVTRSTMYRYLEHEEIKEYMYKDRKGLKMRLEGLNTLNVIMANNYNRTSQNESSEQINVNYNDKYIHSLETQVNELKEEVKKWQDKYQSVVEALLDQKSNTQKLLESNQKVVDTLLDKKKSKWNIFKR